MTKKITLNKEKRNVIAQVIEDHFLNRQSKARQEYDQAKNNYDSNVKQFHNLAYEIVRQHQPQVDVDTIKKMRDKYGNSGGDIYNDNCFNFTTPNIDDEGRRSKDDKEIHISFDLGWDFANAYFDKEIRGAKLNPFNGYAENRSTPTVRTMNNEIEKFLGWRNSDNNNSQKSIKNSWDDSYRFEVIGTSYCGSRHFAVNQETFEKLESFKVMQEKVVSTHERLHDYVKEKMDKVRLGLQSYKYFDEAKSLCNKLGVALNESMIDTQSTMALSVWSPDSLANILADNDEVDNSKADRIALFRQGKLNQQVV